MLLGIWGPPGDLLGVPWSLWGFLGVLGVSEGFEELLGDSGVVVVVVVVVVELPSFTMLEAQNSRSLLC